MWMFHSFISAQKNFGGWVHFKLMYSNAGELTQTGNWTFQFMHLFIWISPTAWTLQCLIMYAKRKTKLKLKWPPTRRLCRPKRAPLLPPEPWQSARGACWRIEFNLRGVVILLRIIKNTISSIVIDLKTFLFSTNSLVKLLSDGTSRWWQ